MNGYKTIDNQNTLVLLIVDMLDWKNEEEHVLRIYEAINKCRAYVERKKDDRKNRVIDMGTRLVIQVFAQYECSEYGNDFYDLIKDFLQDIGFELNVYINNSKFIYI
ncbi:MULTISPECIES: DUF6572 domain-containing protein [Bacillus]|uniref:Uncharacterized protein n=1 Tax=Bacillus thuringiensis serovar sooncheon TaxID=180891 RepID=A0A9Q5SEB4_BACTU|nr:MULTISPECIES: DUF6572 domain-containing protein [Bacillus]OTW73786.1 hypothetical protein BK707_00515 [Bacillus thuringiensis serovar coreanensis]OTX41249.1 hypothetical protein BK724_28595 [Bacillus thuringiensis serovar sooncheon]OTX47253.1 hypothetical protein BK725_27530 [Bacillus thuringiensis serovar guiyangiensis]OTX65631.1 hypothetical protein BK727_22555 [Bacillus thuringiensis serovar roskildiensis]PDZ51278.1 hypothetical protein CON07_11870 [Bacillus sp. AFS094611]